MGKIKRNGIEYSGSSDDATSVNYDNSVSGLNANSVQEGIDELADGLKNTSVVDNLLSTSTTLPLSANQGRVLNEKIEDVNDSLEWKLLGTVNGNTKQALPTGYNELLVVVGHSNMTSNRDCFSIHIIKSTLSHQTNNYFYAGGYLTANSYMGCQIKIEGNYEISCTAVFKNGVDETANYVCSVFYK